MIQRMKKVPLDKGEPYCLQALTTQKVTAFVKKGEEKQAACKVTIDKNIKLPLQKGDKVGTLSVYIGKEKIDTYDLVSDRDVRKVSFLTYYIRKIKNLF